MLLTRPWSTRDSIAAQVSLKGGSTEGPVSCELGLQAEWQWQMQASRMMQANHLKTAFTLVNATGMLQRTSKSRIFKTSMTVVENMLHQHTACASGFALHPFTVT